MSVPQKYRSRLRGPATVIACGGGGILLCLLRVFLERFGERGSIGAFIILLPVPLLFFLISYLLYRKANKIEIARMEEVARMEEARAANADIAGNPVDETEGQPDFSDDSGDIHTSIHYYNQTKEDGWQQNRALYGPKLNTSRTRNIMGTQTGFYYQTDDFRKVLPGYIAGTLIMIIISIVTLILIPFLGIFITIFSIVWIVGMWKKAPIKKWQNQAAKLNGEADNINNPTDEMPENKDLEN